MYVHTFGWTSEPLLRPGRCSFETSITICTSHQTPDTGTTARARAAKSSVMNNHTMSAMAIAKGVREGPGKGRIKRMRRAGDGRYSHAANTAVVQHQQDTRSKTRRRCFEVSVQVRHSWQAWCSRGRLARHRPRQSHKGRHFRRFCISGSLAGHRHHHRQPQAPGCRNSPTPSQCERNTKAKTRPHVRSCHRHAVCSVREGVSRRKHSTPQTYFLATFHTCKG